VERTERRRPHGHDLHTPPLLQLATQLLQRHTPPRCEVLTRLLDCFEVASGQRLVIERRRIETTRERVALDLLALRRLLDLVTRLTVRRS
jgi:hypothetical protein